MDRKTLREVACKSNDIGARIYWVREKLKLKAVDVCRDLNIPTSSYCDREAGLRTHFHEEMLMLCMYFDQKWHDRFRKFNSYPCCKGQEITEITYMWVIFGFDKNKNTLDLLVENIKDTYLERERELLETIERQRNQIDMLDYIDSKSS